MNFRELPGFPSLFLDFLDRIPQAETFLGARPELADAVKAAESARFSSPLATVSRCVEEQLSERQRGRGALENARLLSTREAVAVAGILPAAAAGGPLSVLLKSLTVCRLADELNKAGLHAVPVCCIGPGENGTEPVWLPDSEGQLRNLSPGEAIKDDFGRRVESLISTIAQVAPGQQSTEALQFVRENYAGTTLSSACGRLIAALTDEWGLVVIDGGEPGFATVTLDQVQSLQANDAIIAATSRRREGLEEAGYAWQGQDREQWLRDSLVRVAPSLLLPTIAQVCDPAEVYFMSIVREAFAGLSRPIPVTWPRASTTLLDPRSRKFLGKHGLRLSDLFVDREALLQRIANESEKRKALERFDDVEKAIRNELSGFGDLVRADDAGLREMVESSREKMLYQTNRLKERFLVSSTVRLEAEQRQLERARNSLAPDGRLQEQVIAILHFLLRHSIGLVKYLYENLDISNFDHQTLPVD